MRVTNSSACGSLFEYRRRPTYSLALNINNHFNTVRNFYERNAAIHSVFFAIEGHGAF